MADATQNTEGSGQVQFELVSPQRLVRSEPVDMVVVPCAEGDIGVMIGHTPLIGTVRSGVVDIHLNNAISQRIFVSGGFVEVTESRCTLLAEEAILVEDLNAEEAQARLDAAKSAEDDDEIAIAEGMLAALGLAVTQH